MCTSVSKSDVPNLKHCNHNMTIPMRGERDKSGLECVTVHTGLKFIGKGKDFVNVIAIIHTQI